MSAEIITIADYVKEVLDTAINSGSGSEEAIAEVKRVWELTHNLGSMTGRKIDIYGVGYADGGPVTRAEGFYDVTLTIVTIERYEGDQTDENDGIPYIPVEWVDERINFVEDKIFNVLGSVTESVLEGSTIESNPLRLGEWWTQTLVVTQICDPDFLRQQKVFWSETEITFRRVKRN